MSSYLSTVTQKGQVTIPQPIRKFLGIKPYQKVTFHKKGDQVIIAPVKDFLELQGSLSHLAFKDKSPEEIIQIEEQAIAEGFAGKK